MTASTPYENMKPVQSCSLFTKCCFCIPLRTGCFILGYLSLLLNLLFILLGAASVANIVKPNRGFRYNPTKQTLGENSDNDADEMSMAMMVVMLLGCLQVAWVMLNAFLLIGLHKRRPGPVRIHVAIATVCLLLSGLLLSTLNTINTGDSFQIRASALSWVDIGLSAYFIMLYYVYAMQLEQESISEEVTLPQDVIADLNRRKLFLSYPKNIDKELLTEKDNI